MGTVFDAGCIAPPISKDKPPLWLAPVALVDLPFSLAADTIIFPFDLADSIDHKKKENKPPPPPGSQGAMNGSQPSASQTNRPASTPRSARSP
jgi:hypothetical protein